MITVLVAFMIWCSPGVVPIAVDAPLPWLAPHAAPAFTAARVEIQQATGTDALASLGDALRTPQYATNKPGVAFRSWHKAGRAIDLDQRLPWVVVPDGTLYRVWLHGVDVTAILERHGWSRIPAQLASPEWWHYEYLHGATSWDAAMQAAWPHGAPLSQASCRTFTPARVTAVGPSSGAALGATVRHRRLQRVAPVVGIQAARSTHLAHQWATTAQQTQRTHMRCRHGARMRRGGLRVQATLRAMRDLRHAALHPTPLRFFSIRKEDV